MIVCDVDWVSGPRVKDFHGSLIHTDLNNTDFIQSYYTLYLKINSHSFYLKLYSTNLQKYTKKDLMLKALSTSQRLGHTEIY